MSSSPSNKEYKKSCKTIIEIIEKYGSIDTLNKASNEFQQKKTTSSQKSLQCLYLLPLSEEKASI
jgi:hypothetical protein